MSKGLILSVDDDEVNQMVITSFLEGAGYTVVSLYTGTECLEYLSSSYGVSENPEPSCPIPDAVLLDIVMPGMDGFEVCRSIRHQFSVTLPVILLSARMSKEDILHGLTYGLANDYLTKPFDRAVLLAKLEARIAIKDMISDQSSRTRSTFTSNVYRRLADVSSGTPAVLIVFRDDVMLQSTITNLCHLLSDSGVICFELQFNLCVLVSDSADVLMAFCCTVFGTDSGPSPVIHSVLCFVTNDTPLSTLLSDVFTTDLSGSVIATVDFHSRLSDESVRKFFSNQQIVSPRHSFSIKLVPPIDTLLSYIRSDSPIPIDSEIRSAATASIHRIDQTLKKSDTDKPKLTLQERSSCSQLLTTLTSPETTKIRFDDLFSEFCELRSSLAQIESGLEFEKINFEILRKRYERAIQYKSDLASQLGLVDDLNTDFISLD